MFFSLEGLTRSTRCEGLESAWQGLVAARDGKHPSPNPWKVHKAGCVGFTVLHFTKKQGSARDVTASDKKWHQGMGPEHFGKIRYEKQNSFTRFLLRH